jgi:hypothetical protein
VPSIRCPQAGLRLPAQTTKRADLTSNLQGLCHWSREQFGLIESALRQPRGMQRNRDHREDTRRGVRQDFLGQHPAEADGHRAAAPVLQVADSCAE